MSAWLWLLLAALLVLPVLLRVYVGDEPQNGTGEDLAGKPDDEERDALANAA